jgi:carbohydrate-binding DOMON domain-containing protein
LFTCCMYAMHRYEAGLRVGHRFAAIAPGGGTPFVGHNNAPPVSRNGAVSVIDLHGTNDRTCPANTTTSSDGWNYTPVSLSHGCTHTHTHTHTRTNTNTHTHTHTHSLTHTHTHTHTHLHTYDHRWILC